MIDAAGDILVYSVAVGFRTEAEMNEWCARRDAQEKRLVMADLTQEQVERATEAFWGKAIWPLGYTTTEQIAESVNTGLRAAAPFLQLPWDEPTPEELFAIDRDWLGFAKFVRTFVRNRNAALLPKPVDPRKEKIVTALEGLALQAARYRMAELIIAALDSE